MKHLYLLLVIFLIAFFTLHGFFNFAMTGDDILAIHRFLSGTSWKSLFSPYGGQNIAAGFAYLIFGLNAYHQLVFVFILRAVISLFVYLLGLTFTRRKDFSFFTAVLSIIGFAGIVTAEYTVLIGLHIGLILLLLGLILLTKYYREYANKVTFRSISLFTIISIVLCASFAWATVRVNGILLMFPLLELGLLAFRKSNRKALFVRVIIFGLFVLVLKQLGSFGGDSPYHMETIKENSAAIFSSAKSALRSAYYLVVIYYDILVPPLLDGVVQNALYNLHFIELINSGLYLPIFTFVYIYILIKFNLKRSITFTLVVLWVSYLALFYWCFGNLYKGVLTSSLSTNTTDFLFQAANSMLGGLFVFSVIAYLTKLLTSKRYNESAILTLLFSTPLLFMGATFFFSPRTFYFETFTYYKISVQESNVHYYYIPAIGMYFFICYLLLLSTSKKYIARVALLSLLLAANIISVWGYINVRSQYRSAEVVNNIVNTINSEISSSYLRHERPFVFFLEIDDNRDFFPYAVNEWGFAPYKYSIINNDLSIVPIFDSRTKEDALGSLTSHDFENKYSIKEPISINDIYAFSVNNGEVTSQTAEFREYILDNSNFSVKRL